MEGAVGRRRTQDISRGYFSRDQAGRGARSEAVARYGERFARNEVMRRSRGKYEKGPLEVYLERPVNPAATYSPGPVGQVPSAMQGLTAVFGMGTGVTPAQ